MSLLLEIKNGSFWYLEERPIFLGVSLELSAGDIISIIGPNGVGKSTLMNCITGFNTLNSGSILLNGKDMVTMKRAEIAGIVGYMQQHTYPAFGYEVKDYILMGRAPYISTFRVPSDYDHEICRQIIETMGISHLISRNYTELSGGERQQVEVAKVLVQEPKIIVMDEPTSALDFGNQVKIIKMIRSLALKGIAIILTTHNPDHAIMLGGLVGVMDRDGHLTVGPAKETVSEDLLSKIYNTSIKLTFVEKLGRNVCGAII